MIEQPPRFGSKRFREILVSALRGDPATAFSGVYYLATRRRIRGWSRLMLAASRAPHNYLRWVRNGEVRALARFRRDHPRSAEPPSVITLLLDENAPAEAIDLTVASIRAALGDPLIYGSEARENGIRPVPEAGNLLSALSALADAHRTAWLLLIRAGDQVSAALGDILARSMTGDECLVYWDEDQVHAGERSDPWIKPDWDPILFERLGGMVGASVFSLASARGAAGPAPDGSIGREAAEKLLLHLAGTNRPKHIALILTHRAETLDVSRAPIILPAPPARWPSVSVIVPTRDRPELLAACLKGIDETEYPGPIQIVVVDNASRDPDAVELLERAESDPRVRLIRDHGDFNFSRLNNAAAVIAEGELLCLLNNDVEPIDKDWLTRLVRFAVQEDVGAVGPQLLYPSGRIQHAGVAIGVGGAAGHVQKGVDPTDGNFRTWHAVTRETSALTAAVLVLKKSVFAQVGGFDEAFAVAFNDVDLCLRLGQMGLRNIYVADVRLLHRESESRGEDRSPTQARRFAGELARLQAKWGTEGYCDPYFSPLFSRLVERCILAP